MRLGFLTEYSEERVRAAKEMGFDALEVRTMGEPLGDADKLAQMRATLDENGIGVTAVACYVNHLEEGKEAERLELFRSLIESAPALGCNVLATVSGCTQASRDSGDIFATIPAFKKYFSELSKIAEDNNVKIAFENWPGGHPWPLVLNIAFSPQGWDAIFDAVPSPALGLEYDPSHLVRLNIEYLPIIKRYAERIHHIHAKDTTIDKDALNEVGYIGQGWWRYSIPSLGVVDWDGVFRELAAIGYDGGVAIEHEDDHFLREKFDEGLRIGQKFLSQWVK